MAQGQGEIEPRRCPRCGGIMRKPPGSSLFWHADNNHPQCDITNIVDTTLTVQTGDESSHDQPKSNRRKK